jgi:hypothetical protein
MKIRIALGSALAALVVTAGVVASTGTASAAQGHSHDGGDVNCTSATACTGPGGTPYTGPVTACTSYPCELNPNGTLDTDPAHHFPHPGFPGGFGGGFGGGYGGGLNLLNGNVLVLGDGVQANVCDYPQWGPFYNHWGAHFGGLRDQLNELRYRQLIQQANCGSNLGGLTLLNGNLLDLGSYGVLGGDRVNVCQYSSWNDFSQFGQRRFGQHWGGFGSHWGGVLGGGGWGQLRQRANCQQVVIVNNGGNTVVNQPAPLTAPAPATSLEAPAPAPAPAPLTGSGNYHYPSSAPDTGN